VSLAPGVRLGPYEVTALIGEGGMGKVWRARHTTLKRDDALKVLPDAFASDPDRLARFQREAQILASLNHPNIAHVYGLEQADGVQALVMELVEGPTLADRITRGPISLDEALTIAKQIAEALEAAHEQGIIHRDLKPANIKLRPDGAVKVLDFGLAKLAEPGFGTQGSGLEGAVSMSPTITSPALVSGVGVLLGTAAYMSPEQAKGRPADKRSDIWAFGCVLYEMLTRRAVFEGDTIGEILGGVFKAEPDWRRLPAETPEAIRRLLRRCLQKDRSRRLKNADDARIEIEEALTEPPAVTPQDAAAIRNPRPAWIVATLATLALASLAIVHFREKPVAEAPEMRVEITTPSTQAPFEFALSPNGRFIVFVASGDGPQRLWLRALDKTDAQPLVGTEGADYPFWSPDSRSIGFTASGKLKRIDIDGGRPEALAASQVRGGAWNADGTIIFNATLGPLSRIAASGGETVVVTRLDPPRQVQHVFPQFLSDNRHFLYYALGTPEAAGIYLGSLDGTEPKRLTAADSTGAYLPQGMSGANASPIGRSSEETIVFTRQTTLMAQRLDLQRGELTGDPVRLADAVGGNGVIGFGGFSISADGRVAYRAGGGALRQLKWYTRTGKAVSVVGDPDSASLLYPELSPDGAYVALTRTVQNDSDVWLVDLVRGGMTRFTFDPSVDVAQTWSPDRMRIAFSSTRKGPFNLYVKSASGAGAEVPLLETPNSKYVHDWSSNGQFLLYGDTDPKTGRDLWALPITGNDRKPFDVVKTPFEELNGQFSPDTRWVAYETNESGRFEIVVQPFPVATGKWQVSTGGGIQPRWRADGKELYFVAADGKLMAASITTSGATFAAGTPVPLFPVTLPQGLGANKQEYAVSRDGRFLINQPIEASTAPPITLILNWKPAAK
jgi:eukaryotic-like serine/threonine-protein kinase